MARRRSSSRRSSSRRSSSRKRSSAKRSTSRRSSTKRTTSKRSGRTARKVSTKRSTRTRTTRSRVARKAARTTSRARSPSVRRTVIKRTRTVSPPRSKAFNRRLLTGGRIATKPRPTPKTLGTFKVHGKTVKLSAAALKFYQSKGVQPKAVGVYSSPLAQAVAAGLPIGGAIIPPSRQCPEGTIKALIGFHRNKRLGCRPLNSPLATPQIPRIVNQSQAWTNPQGLNQLHVSQQQKQAVNRRRFQPNGNSNPWNPIEGMAGLFGLSPQMSPESQWLPQRNESTINPDRPTYTAFAQGKAQQEAYAASPQGFNTSMLGSSPVNPTDFDPKSEIKNLLQNKYVLYIGLGIGALVILKIVMGMGGGGRPRY